MRPRLALLLTLSLTAMVLGGNARAADVVMKLGSITINDIQHAFCDKLEAELEQRSGGRIDVQVFPAGQLGSIQRQIEGLQFGTQEAFVSPPGFFTGIAPELQVADAPGLFRNMDDAHRIVTHPLFREPFLRAPEGAGIVGAGIFIHGPHVIATVPAVRSLADLRGKKIRVLASELESALAARLGMTGVPMGFGEVLPALQQGTIDGVRTNMGVMTGMKFYDTTKHVVLTHAGMIAVGVWYSKFWLDALPADLRELVVSTTAALEGWATEEAKKREAAALEIWRDHGVNFVELPLPEQAAMFDQLRPLGDQYLGKGGATKQMYEALKAAASASRTDG
ncbi:MAG: TRAP transporter substrate-binding protein [Pseudomonadota bacterium]